MIKLLLVDDETEFSEYMKKRLVRRDMEVDLAASGEQALEMLKDKRYDIMILDMLMPGMDGTETLKHAKKQSPEMEVIMLTGHGTVESAVKGVKLGAFDYLLKPSDMDSLLETINKAYEQKLQNDEEKLQERIALALMSPRQSVRKHDED